MAGFRIISKFPRHNKEAIGNLNIEVFRHFHNPEFKILADFKILAFRVPEFKILAYFKILAFQNSEFKILADLKILADYKMLAFHC